MAYTATITDIQNADPASGTLYMDVKFDDGNGNTTTKNYQLTSTQYQTLQQIQDMLSQECANLDAWAAVAALVTPLVGTPDVVAAMQNIGQ